MTDRPEATCSTAPEGVQPAARAAAARAQSPEYPDLLWMPPKSWTNANRSSVQLIVIHTTEGSAHASSAEDGAAYDQVRTDGTSSHYYVDSDSVVQCVRTADQAHTARRQGNRRGVQYELCGRAYTQDWDSPYSQAMLRLAAKQAARDATKWGIPVRHPTAADVAAGVKGFCGHGDITRAFPEDGGTHTDPGPNFPWSQFLDLVRAELEEDDMPTAEEIATAVWQAKPWSADYTAASALQRSYGQGLADAARDADTLQQILAAIRADDDVDEQAVAAAVLADLNPTAIAQAVVAALPTDQAQRVVDELRERLDA